MASVVVPDLTKPAAPGGLTVTVPDVASKRLPLVGVTASSVLGPAWDAANLGDGDSTSSWASAASDTSTPAELVVDLGAARSIEEVRLTPDVKYLELFPPAFRIGVSVDGFKMASGDASQGTGDGARSFSFDQDVDGAPGLRHVARPARQFGDAVASIPGRH